MNEARVAVLTGARVDWARKSQGTPPPGASGSQSTAIDRVEEPTEVGHERVSDPMHATNTSGGSIRGSVKAVRPSVHLGSNRRDLRR